MSFGTFHSAETLSNTGVVVTGANGWIGKAICDRLSASGTIVYPFQGIRSPAIEAPRGFFVDLSEPRSLASAVKSFRDQKLKAECLIHCAGAAHQPNETEEVVNLMRRVNVDGTRHIVHFCKQTGIDRVLYLASISPYKWPEPPKPVGEEALVSPSSAYAESKQRGEELVANSGLDWRIVRLATVFGAGDRANFLKLSTALRKRHFILPGSGSARKSVIPVDLAVRLIAEFARLDEPKHRLINLALPEAPTLKEICDSFSSVCDFPRAPSAPLPLLRLLAKAGDLASHIRPMPLNSSVIAKLTTSTWVDTQRMQDVFGTIPQDSFETHLQRHRDYYRNA